MSQISESNFWEFKFSKVETSSVTTTLWKLYFQLLETMQ